jgi:transposase
MGNISTIGVDIAKHVFWLCCGNDAGRVITRKRLYRRDLLDFMRNQPASLVGMEACSGAHYWGREFHKMGHTVKLMAPQYVKPYVKTNKNDANDAEGCFEAVSRPTMRFVAVKTEHQQSLAQIHRVRERLVAERTALSNQMRGFLHEFGIVIPKGVATVCARVVVALSEHAEEVPELSKEVVNRLVSEFGRIEEEVKFYDKKLGELHKSMPESQRLATIGGIGKITATAMVTMISDIKQFRSGRQFAAFLGLTPRQTTTGGKARLGRISKRGDKYIRKLLVQGALSELRHLGNKTDRRSLWLKGLLERKKKMGKVAVALANKNARIVWALLVRGGDFERGHALESERKAA